MKPRCLLLLTALLAGCSTSSPEPLWVGHLVPLSGPGRDQGEQAVAAMNQALEQARQDDVTISGRPLGIRHVDAAKGTARAEAVRLLSVNRAAALVVGPGVEKPDEVVAAARLHGAVVIVLDELTDVPRESKGVVLLAADPARRGQALADFARKELKRSKAALVVDETRPICVAVADAFGRAWRGGKSEWRRWKRDDLRQKAPAENLKRFKPDVFLLAVAADQPDSTLIDLVGSGVALYGGEDHDGPPLPWLDRGTKDGPTVYTATAWSSVAQMPEEARKRLDEWQKKQGRPSTRSAVLALDAVGLLQKRPQLLSDLDRARHLSKRLELLGEMAPLAEFESLAGPMSWKEGRPVRPLFLVRSQLGQETLVRPLPAGQQKGYQ
jgi:ABC-type branched-subunit amino acid transport system substrate-binding protein